jgi:hypothetical protein
MNWFITRHISTTTWSSSSLRFPPSDMKSTPNKQPAKKKLSSTCLRMSVNFYRTTHVLQKRLRTFVGLRDPMSQKNVLFIVTTVATSNTSFPKSKVVPVLNSLSTVPRRHVRKWRCSLTILDLALPRRKTDRYPSDGKLGGPQSRSGHCGVYPFMFYKRNYLYQADLPPYHHWEKHNEVPKSWSDKMEFLIDN